MTVRLRAHHLLCLLTFVGKGYTPAFTAHYRRIVRRLDAGEDVEMVAGPDDICAPMLADGHHCLEARIADRDAEAAQAVAALLGMSVAEGARFILAADVLGRLRTGFAEGVVRQACTACQWAPLCDGIAGSGYAGTLLKGAEG
ncbi:DUF1284 domain-containing protein [Ancylobacter sp. 6x-1]|uniref:DUF1284 domain-containing protein n=1 Tax=Ancylobacter crimeensis TaxID=2579147 RepID=A0ABT0D7Q3_9HYPH|nr:DUF1284 domain-containing protein [Ancylobacter crimeensis]MCK0195981.1 DUF1284 domain-containing protein [Ancylobacter crimeensis]